MTSSRAGRRLALIFVVVFVVGAGPSPQSADGHHLAMGGGYAVVPFDSPCGRDGIGWLSGTGRLRRTMLPPGASYGADAAAGSGGFGGVWRSGPRRSPQLEVVSASAHPATGLGAPFLHGVQNRHDPPPRIAVGARGDRVVLWADQPGLRLQRVSSGNRAEPPITVDHREPGQPAVTATELVPAANGSVWAVWLEQASRIAARHIPADGPPGPALTVLRPPPEYADGLELVDLDADGRGGVFVLASYDDAEALIGSGEVGTVTLSALHVEGTKARLRWRSAGTPGLLEGRLTALPNGHGAVAYHHYRSFGGRGSVWVRRLPARGRTGKPRRVRRDRQVLDLDIGARGGRPLFLLGAVFHDVDRLFLNGLKGRPRGLALANAGWNRPGEGREFAREELTVDTHGRAFVAWVRTPHLEDDPPDRGFARVVVRGGPKPVRVLFRCR